MKEIIEAQRRRRVPEAGSVENPPGTEGGPDRPMCLLPEIRDLGFSVQKDNCHLIVTGSLLLRLGLPKRVFKLWSQTLDRR